MSMADCGCDLPIADANSISLFRHDACQSPVVTDRRYPLNSASGTIKPLRSVRHPK